MFCKQNAYTPKSLDSSSILQRIHTKTGTAARKLISKQDFLQPYFDGEFSDVHSSRIAQNIERYIKITKKYQRETKFFVEAVLNRIYLLHKYNLQVAEVTFKYPLSPNFTQLLLRYVVLECSVLYKREHHTPRYEATVQERILRLLQNVYNSYLETLNGVPPEKLLNERCTAILNLFIKIKSEFEVQNDLMENIAKKLLKKMGRLEQVNALKKKCIPCPLDTFLSDPAVVNSYKNIITSDYGTDEDLKIEEEVIQVDPQNEDDDSVEEPDIKQDISEILRVANGLHQVPATNSQVKKVPTIYIDDDNEEMIVLEEEIETSSKSARRQRAEEENKLLLREKQYEMFSNHKPFDDIKPYVKDEVIDLDSDEESGTTESCVNETNTRVAVEVVVIDDDADSTAVQPPIAWDSPTVIKELNEEDILELSSDEDESPNVIPKEEEEELLKDEADDQANRSPQAVGDSNTTNTAIHSNTFDINTSGLSQEENKISVDNSTEPSNMPYPSRTDTLTSSSEETLATRRENVSIEERPSNDSAEGIQRGIKLELDTPKDNPDNQEKADIESEMKLTCDELRTVAAHHESTENSSIENEIVKNEIVKNETENVTEEDIDLNTENGKTLNGEPEPKSDELHVIKSVEDPSKSLLENDPVNEAGTSIKPKGIHRNSLLTEGKCPPLTNEENLVSQCKNIEENEIEDLKNSLLDQREDDANTSMEQKKANDSDNILEASEVEEALLEDKNVDTRFTVSRSLEVAGDFETCSENTEYKSRPEESDSRIVENNEILEVPTSLNEEENIDSNEKLSDNTENVNVTCNRAPLGVIDDTTAAESMVSNTDEVKDEPVSIRGESMNWDEKNDDLRENESLDQSNTDKETVNETRTKAARDEVEEDASSIGMSHSKEQTSSNVVQVQEEIVGKCTEVDVDQENSGSIENQNVAENETITEAIVEPETETLEEGNVNTHFEDAETIDRKNSGNENLDRVNETGSVSDEAESGTKELSNVSEGEGTSEDRHKEQPEGNKVSEECSDAGDNTMSDRAFKPSSNEVEELYEGMEEIIEGSEDVEDEEVEAPSSEIKEVEQIIGEPTENVLDKIIVDDIEDAVVDAPSSEIKEVEQIMGEPTENFLFKKILDDSVDAVVEAPGSEVIDKEAEQISEEPTENFLDKIIVDDIEDAVVDAPNGEIKEIKEVEQIIGEPTEDFLDKKIVDNSEDAVVDAPSSEIKEVEQIIGEPTENFLDKKIVDDSEDAVVEAPSSEVIDKEAEQISEEPSENVLDKIIVDDIEDAVVDAPNGEIKEIKEVEQIIGEPTEDFLDKKIVDDSEDTVVDAPSSEIKEVEQIIGEPRENFLDKKIVDDSEDAVVEAPSSEVIDKEAEQISEEPSENFLDKIIVDDIEDAVVDAPNGEIKEIKEVEQIIGEPTEDFLDKKIVDDSEDTVVDAPSSEIKEVEQIIGEPTENFLDKKIVDDIEDAVVEAPSSEIKEIQEVEQIIEKPTKNFLDEKIVDDSEDAVVDAPNSEIKEIKKEVEQIIAEPTENFLDRKIVDDIEDAVIDAPSSEIKEIKEVEQIIGEPTENFLDKKIVDDIEDAVVEAPSSEIINKEAEMITEEPTENFLDKKIVDDSEDAVVDAPNSEIKEIKEVEQIIEKPTKNFLDEKIVDDGEDAVNDTTNDHMESTLTEEGLNLQTNEENIETQEVFQFRNTEHEIVITAEDVGSFELIEQEVHKTDDIPTEEQYGNEKITKEVEGFPENAYVGSTSHETEIINFEMAKSIEPNITEEICYGKYNESTLIDDLNIQKEEIITEVHTLDLGVSEEFVINGSHSQIVPAPVEMELPLMKTEKIEVGNTVTNNQIIPKQVGQNLEICGIPDENTYLDILATVATEMSRQDLLKKKKKKKNVHNEPRKKQFNSKAKIERGQERRNPKIKSKGALDISAKVEKRVTRSTRTKKKTEAYLEPKCKPHDFVFTNNSGVPPPSNNIYTQKLSEIPLTSEDSNDSEGILLIDEDIDVKSNKPNPPRMKKLPCYDEDTMEENIIFRYEPKVQGTVLISIPDTYQGNFEFLTQIEQLDNCSSHPFANVPNSQGDIFPEEETYFGDLPSSKNSKNLVEIKPDDDISQKPDNSSLEKKNHKPFRTKAEQKDYDKFTLKPYVSIERLNITSKNEEKHKHGRSKSFETGITTDKSTVCEVNSDVLKNEPTEVDHEKVFKDEINNVPKKIKGESNTEEANREDSDDDIPLLQRTLFELKQTKKSVTETKKEKSDQKTSFDKTAKVKSGVKSKTKPKKTHVDVKDVAKRLPKKLINEEKTTNTSSPNDVPATANLTQTSVHPTVSPADTLEKDICPASSEPVTDKNNTNEPVPKSNQQIKSDGPSYEEFMKSSNTKYYTTPKLRRKSVSKHNLNRSDIKFEDTKQVIFNADKKYYTPPKLRRKSMVENENGTDTKKITPKQLKVSTSKVDILSKCKNTISPTTEKLKKKLEIDFKLNCTELSAEETREIGDGDHVPSLEMANSDVTETTPVDWPENEDQLIRDVNDTNTMADVSEQNIREEETDKDLPITQTNISETTECELNTKLENSQSPDTLTDKKESRPSNEIEEISTEASKFTPPTIENPTEDIQEAELEICKAKTVDVSKTQSDSEMDKIQDSASNKSGTGASENVEVSGSSVDKLIENEENLDDLPLSKRTSMSSHLVLKEPEFKIEMKPHRKSVKKTASDIESNFETENKKQQNTDTDNIKIGLKNETIPKFKTKRTKEPQKPIPNEIKLPEQGSCTKKDNELTKSEGKTKSQKDSKVKSDKLSKKHKNKIENNKKKTSKTRRGLSGESPKKFSDKTENVGLDIKNKNISSRFIESINLKEMSEEPKVDGNNIKEGVLTEQVKDEGSKVTDKTESDVQAELVLGKSSSASGDSISKEENANDKLLENSTEPKSRDNQFKDKSDQLAGSKDDNNSGFSSSGLSLKSKDTNNDHHIPKKKKKLPNRTLKPIKTKTSLVNKVLPENGLDVLENCNVLTSVKTTNNSALKNKVHGKGNKVEKCKKDKKRTFHGKTETSKIMEKTNQKEDTEAIKDKANTTESTDISQINSTIGNLTGHSTEVPLTVVSEEIVDSSDYKANSIEKSNAELVLDEHVQGVEEEKTEETPEMDETSVSVDTNVKENISMADHESELDVPAENPLDIEPSRTNQEISVISDEPNAELPTDKPVEDPMEDEHPSDINEQVLLSNREPDSKPQVDIPVDIPLQSENSSEDNEIRCVENNVVEETGNYTITIPSEKVSKEGNTSTDKVTEISDFDSNGTFQATESKEKYDDNKTDGMLNEQSEKPVCEDKNTVPDEVDEEIKLEERCDDGNVHHQCADSKADNALDKNLQLETEQQVKKHIGEDDFATTTAIEDTVVESIESQDEKLETVPISDQEPEEIVEEKGSSPLTEVEKENDSPKSTETEDKGLQNSQELIEHSESQKKDQLTDLKNDSVKDNLEIKQICDNDIKVKNTEEGFNGCTPAKSANEGSNVNMLVNVAPNLSVKKGKRRNDTLTEEEACTEKRSKLSEIMIDVSSGGVQDFSTKSPKLHSPSSTSPRKKDKKSIECIISQLKEEKGNSAEAKEELVKSASSPVAIDVGSLRKKLLQKIKGHNSFKGPQSGEQKSDIVVSKDKTVLDIESVHTDAAVVPVESDAAEVENGSSIVPTKEFPTTSVMSSEIEHNMAEDQADKVPCNEDSAPNVEESELNETENARRETELMEAGIDNIHNSTLVEPVITPFASEITNNSVKDNSENSSTTLEESEVSEVRHEHFDSPSVKDREEEITVKDHDASKDPPVTDKESKEPNFSCTTDISGDFSDDNENKSIIESETSNAVKETSETADSSPLIKPENTPRHSPVEILSECVSSSCSLPIDTSKNSKDTDSFDQPKKSFSNSCLEITPNKSMESVNSCVEDFEPANVDPNLLNLCDLMLHVDSVGNVTRRIEESVSSETVCMLSDIISPTISSTNNKLPCVTSAATIKFTFPVTSQADIKDQLIPMNEVDTKKGIFDDSPMSTEKLPPKNGSCLFSLNERMDDASSRTLSSSSISLSLQEVDFSKIPIDSSQAFDLISPNSMIQTSARSDFINEIPVDNEVSDIMETRSSNTIDHNYTMELLGGPLLSGRPEETHIFFSAFNKNLVDSPGEFPLNDNQLPSELSESDDTYKLNLDNEYAVKNLVMLGGQTSDISSFPLSNYNLSDIERMNLIEDSISNSEDNSNSLDTASLVTSIEHESRDIPSNVNAWTQFITDESSNQRGTVPSCGPRLTSPFSISQNDIIQPGALTAPCFDEDTLLKESPGAELKMPVKGSLELKENDPWARFIANENLAQKVVVLPNEQYLTSSFPISQSDFVQSTALISPCVDNEIIVEGTSDLNMDNEQTKLETSKDEKKTDVKNEQTSKSNVKRSKKPKKATQKEVPRNDDFLPKRTYSRTVLRAPLKKNGSSPADNGKNPSQNKTIQPNEQPEGNLKLKPANATTFGEKSLPNVAPMTTEILQKDSKQNPKDVPANPPSKRSKLDLSHPNNIPVQNPLQTSSPPVIPNNKKSTAVKELKLPTSEAKNLQNLPSTILKTKETPGNSAKLFVDTADKKSDAQSTPELTKQWKDPTKLLTDVSEEKPAQSLIDMTDKIPDVHCNIAELVKFRKRGLNNKYSNNNSPSPAKELRSEAAKSKKIPEKPLTSTPKPELTPQEPKGQHRDQKSPTGHLLLAKSYTPKHEPESKTPQPQTKPSVKENKSETVIAAENKSHAALPQPCQSKSNHSIDSILNKEPKSSTSYLTGGLIKDYKSLKSQGVKRPLTTTENDGTQKKQIKVNYPEQRQSDSNIDKTFDNLLQQGNVNKLILLRVTDDNKLKPERKYSPSLKPGGSQNASNLPGRSRGKSKELNEATKKEIERRTTLLMKQHGKRDLEAFDKLRMDRGSPSVKLDGRSKEQKEYNKHTWSREGGSGRTKTREDSRSYGSLRSDKGRDQYYSDYNRRREAYYSDHVRGKEGHYSGYGGRRDGHHPNHSRSREHHFEHGSGSVPRSSGSAHPAGGRSSNVSGSYYKSLHVNQDGEQSSHPGSRHGAGPYMKRGATLTEEKQNELLNALRDMVHKQLNSSGFKKSSAEEDYAWIEKLNQFNETPQFIPQPPSPPSDHK